MKCLPALLIAILCLSPLYYINGQNQPDNKQNQLQEHLARREAELKYAKLNRFPSQAMLDDALIFEFGQHNIQAISTLPKEEPAGARKDSMECHIEHRPDGILYRIENYYYDHKLIRSRAFPLDTLEILSNRRKSDMTAGSRLKSTSADDIITQDPVNSMDSLALVAIYNATGGDNWTNKDNWLTGPVSTWNGVTVNDGKVSGLWLYNNNLTGSLPADIGNLVNLQWLSLWNNHLTGTLPASIGNLTQLLSLEIGNSGLTGPLPEELFTLSNLQTLSISSMNLTGNVPSGIANLVNLTSLDLGFNQFNDAFPNALLTMTQLTSLSLDNNQFYGTIPATISNLVNLQRLSLNYSGLTGPLPEELFSMTTVTDLGLAGFGLSGTIPAGIANLTILNFLNLSNNQLDGIPVELYNLNNLRGLYLSYNNFSGPVPEQIFTLTNLYSLSLAGNKFSGSFSTAVTNLTNLGYLDIWNNDLTNLPVLTSLTNLWGVFAENNYFTFEDIEPNMGIASGNFYYAPQKEAGETQRFDFTEGSDYSFSVSVGGSSNNYQWYKDYALIEGSTGSTHEIVSATTADIGRYHCGVTSNVVTNLTIVCKPVFLSIPVNPADSAALAAFYNSTGGDGWYNKNGWLTSPVEEWYGVVVEGGRVVTLELYNNNLSGSLPAEIGNLTGLRILNLYGNKLNGELPVTIGNLINLETLVLFDNMFSGAVPAEINSLVNLLTLDITRNQFDDLPVLTGLTALQYAYIGENNFTFEDIEPNLSVASGYINYSPQNETGEMHIFTFTSGISYSFDATIGGSSNNYQWFLNNNYIDGATAAVYEIESAAESDRGKYTCRITSNVVPYLTLQTKPFILPYPVSTTDSLALVALYNSTGGNNWAHNDGWLSQSALAWYGVTFEGARVSSLSLYDNNLGGTLPAELGNLTALHTLDLAVNSITGELPGEVINLVNLQNLYLNGNSISGPVPLALTSLTNLGYLDLSNNQLTGNIPAGIGSLVNLYGLYISFNQLSGSIPAEMGNLINLNYLDLIFNDLTGNIPSSFGNLVNLSYMSLSYNELSGEIPAEIGNLTNLNSLHLNGNQFTGDVPATINNLIYLSWLDLRDNTLSGLPELTGPENLYYLNIENNRFNFDDIEYNMDEVTGSYYYSTQANTGESISVDVPQRSSYTIASGSGGTYSQYRWMKDGVTLPGATLSSLTIGPATMADAGTYTCEITNTLAPNLTLYRNPVQITIVPPEEHFIPVWDGYGMDHMNFYILSATVDGLELQPGDEVGIFDGEICIGSGMLTEVLDGSNFLSVVVSRDDELTEETDGYTLGNRATFRLWDAAAQQEYELVDTVYSQGDGIFEAGGTAVVSLAVTTATVQYIPLSQGWNIFSLAVQPQSINMKAIVQPLIDAGVLIKVQDENGQAIENVFPIGWVNNIGDWSFTEGYKIKVSVDTQLTVTGLPVPLPANIDLGTGWNIFGYPLLGAQDAKNAVSTLVTNGTLIKVQDESGLAIEYVFPIGWVYDIVNLEPGEGYKIKVNADDMLILNEAGTMKSTVNVGNTSPQPIHFKKVWTGKGYDHMNIYLVTSSADGGMLQPGDEIGIFDGDRCVGAAVISSTGAKYLCIAASADDPTTAEIDGFTKGNGITFRLWKAGNKTEIAIKGNEFLQSYDGLFEPLGTTVAGLTIESDGINTWATSLGDNYPNPFTTETTIPYSIGEKSEVELAVYNMLGQRVKTLVHSMQNAGSYQVTWDGTGQNNEKIGAGIYLCRMVAGDEVIVKILEFTIY